MQAMVLINEREDLEKIISVLREALKRICPSLKFGSCLIEVNEEKVNILIAKKTIPREISKKGRKKQSAYIP